MRILFAPRARLPGIMFLAFALRLALATQAPTPGIADPTHYYNLGRNLAAGRGFVIDYIWQYHTPPADVTHPDDYWMPLAAILAALPMRLFGPSLLASLLPAMLFGAILLPLLSYSIGRQLDLSPDGCLFAAAATAFTPELVLNSVRTDTTIFYVSFAGTALLAMHHALASDTARRRDRWLLCAGALAGLAYLTRQDGLLLLPTFLLSLAMFRWAGVRPASGTAVLRLAGWFAAPWLLVVGPWLVRNQVTFGTPFTGKVTRTLFVTTFIDQFTYGRELSLRTYLSWGIDNIVDKIAFEGAANVKMMVVLLSVMSPAVCVGIGRLGMDRAGRRMLPPFLPAGLFLLVLFAFYTVLAPFHSQGGSFKKSAMTLIPLAMAVGAWAVGKYVSPAMARRAFVGALVSLLAFHGVDLVRTDFLAAARYDRSVRRIVEALRLQGDANGDGRIVVMSQDPYQFNLHGIHGLMFPSDDRPTIFAVADRYHVDYFVLPAARPALDPITEGRETDPHLRLLWEDSRQGPYVYRYVHADAIAPRP